MLVVREVGSPLVGVGWANKVGLYTRAYDLLHTTCSIWVSSRLDMGLALIDGMYVCMYVGTNTKL